MVFSSLLFIFYFLPITLLIYYLSPKKLRNLVLFISSLIFYAWGEPIYILLMLFSTLVDYTHGRLLEHQRFSRKAKLIVASSVIVNISLLGFFKYYDFFVNSLNILLGTSLPILNLPLPIGISFYTFQTMSYTIDVYRKEADVQRNLITFGAYVSMFPQLIAGPIVRYKTVAKQLINRQENWNLFAQGTNRFLIGLAKKVLLANQIGLLWATIQQNFPSGISASEAWLGMIAFAFQLYFDFSGYSDMAIGLGKMFGFELPENFNYPYLAKNMTEFWRRWHISLGTWFREYVYIPLGGNRCSVPRHIFNMMVVWFLMGFWHGSSWNFIIWGGCFGIVMIIEKYLIKTSLDHLPAILRQIGTFVLFLLLMVIFSFESFSDIFIYYRYMFSFTNFISNQSLYYLSSYGILLLICSLFIGPWIPNVFDKISVRRTWIFSFFRLTTAISGLILIIAYLVDATYNPFLYFRF